MSVYCLRNSGGFKKTNTKPIIKFNAKSLNVSHKVQRFFMKAELSTEEQGPALITLQQLMPDFTVMQPHINTGLVALSMSEWAASSVTM